MTGYPKYRKPPPNHRILESMSKKGAVHRLRQALPKLTVIVMNLFIAPIDPQPFPSQNDQLFQALETRWMTAVQSQNIKTLEKILAPEFKLTTTLEGEALEVTTGAEYIDACKGYYVIHEYEFLELKTIVFKDTAVVSSRYRQKATLGETKDRSAEFFLTDIGGSKTGVGGGGALFKPA